MRVLKYYKVNKNKVFYCKALGCETIKNTKKLFWYKNVPIETSMEIFNVEQILWKFPIYFN